MSETETEEAAEPLEVARGRSGESTQVWMTYPCAATDS